MDKNIFGMLTNLFGKKPETAGTPTALPLDELASFLSVSPAAMAAFEKAYKEQAMDTKDNDGNLFDRNNRDMSNEARTLKRVIENPEAIKASAEICSRIAAALAEMTPVTDGSERFLPCPAAQETGITAAEINVLPKELRPQLTDSLYAVDINSPSFPMLLTYLNSAMYAKDAKEAQAMYNRFRQGLDTLDLDQVTYRMLSNNPNSMSHWLPAIKYAAERHGFFKIPKTKIAKVPLPILQMSRLDYTSLTPATLKIVDEWAMKAFDLDVNKSYFIKTGTFSSKFDFRNAKVTGEKEVRELGEYLLFIQSQAVQMASLLSKPTIVGASTTNEWVVREFIEDVEDNPTIYKGLPLHTEYRVFVDFENKRVLGTANYWDPEMMLTRFSKNADSSVHDMHDYTVYKAHMPVLTKRYYENVGTVTNKIKELIPDVALRGQWSIDIMQNGNDFWIIDMATADTSALNNVIPLGEMRGYPINWLPEIATMDYEDMKELNEGTKTE